MSTKSANDKLSALRSLMQEHNVGAYVVPSEDAHMSEYTAPVDQRREYLTSFTGSAGTAIVTKDEARFWTDGRYFLQAEKQLGKEWILMKSGMTGVPTWQQWLKNDLPAKSRIGMDPTILAHAEHSSLTKSLSEGNKSYIVAIDDNLVDDVWGTERHPRPSNPVIQLEDKYAGASVGSKLTKLRELLNQVGSPGIVVTQLDEVAWMFNLRGSDIAYNPVFFAYAILTPDDCNLFVNAKCLSEPIRDYLHKNNVSILDYEKVWPHLKTLGERTKESRAQKAKEEEEKGSTGPKEITLPDGEKIIKTDKVLVGKKTSWAVVRVLGEENVEVRRSFVEDEKAKKNATEIEGFRQCNIRDGAALCRYFAWLEEELSKGAKLTEYSAAKELENFRKQNEKFMGLSFSTISSTGPNAAVIHYEATENDTAVIDPNQIYLCDSGAQYLDGTTDTTRTMHFGTPTEEEKLANTRVLQGHIALDRAVFPKGTSGFVLDAIARIPLWQDGLDFRHGTGHGVGHFLNVHEGPQGISPRPTTLDIALKEGMVISNEPGYYADGKFGIRIENVFAVKRANTRENFGGKGYLEFEHFTMVPMQTKLVQHDLLAPIEKKWLNDYHAEVLEKVTPVLKSFGDDRALKWLERECKAI
ncbi:peptidase M24, structural domain-containing protein [Kockovaella imperatae]|uniref:Peptidase M24, structural domain-containing protein n=1 Tax=Kockovaella imperatae TaxID=4999 RepID=A0A1Y1U6E5_9TREE|nr:peptidase M24, structural domain-containing protein [Kockovaella imperatae]ORX33572.1 peptidase M24, structural domain-containing protein [Kockovaella imperatae]